jgi:PKD repeat protein
MKITLFVIGLCFALVIPGFTQTTIVMQPGPVDGIDSYINSVIPNEPGGAKPELVACGWTFQGAFGIGRSLLKFNLSRIPTGSHITSAKLTLYFNAGSTFGAQTGANSSTLRKVTQVWDEMAVTWNTIPSSTTAGEVHIPQTTSPTQDITDIDVTDFVSNWVTDPTTNFGMIHQLDNEVTYNCIVYHSSDYGDSTKRPKLVVTYECNLPVAKFGTRITTPVVAFIDSSLNAISWHWDFGDGSSATIQNPVHTYTTEGNYKVCLKVHDTCGDDSICKIINVCELPSPHFTYIVGGNMVYFSDISYNGTAWYWSFNDGFYSDLKDPQHYFNLPGTYYVCERVFNLCGYRTFCDSVMVESERVNTSDPNTNYYNLNAGPNPAHDNIMVSFKAQITGDMTIDLINPLNIQLYSFMKEVIIGENRLQLNIPGLSPGIYFLKVELGGTRSLIKLIVN